MSHRTITNQYCDCKLQHIQFINPSCESANECRLKTAHASMLTTINKQQWAHHGPSHTQGIWQTFTHSWCCSTWATYHPNPPKDTLLFLLSMVPLYSPDSNSSSPSTLSLLYRPSVLVFQYLTITLSVSSLSRVHLSLSLSLKWFHSPPSFSPFVWQFGVLFSHLLCHSLSLQHTTLHIKSWREEGEGGEAESNIYIFFLNLIL